MTWNASDFDNITQMRVPFDDIWTPGRKDLLKTL